MAQIDQGQQAVAQAQHRRAVDALDGVLGVGGGAHQLDHRKLRNGEALRSAFDDQRRDDGEGERNLDDELGAATLDRGQLDGAADLLDVGSHHVHADAAARDRGHRRRRREAGLEDERSEEHTSELQSLMRSSYAVFCLKKKKIIEKMNNTSTKQHMANKTKIA